MAVIPTRCGLIGERQCRDPVGEFGVIENRRRTVGDWHRVSAPRFAEEAVSDTRRVPQQIPDRGRALQRLELERTLSCFIGKIDAHFCIRKGMNVFRYGIIEGRLNLRVGHWGAINGKNPWKDCDVAVIYGLPYINQRRAINSLFATPRGPQETAWLQANTHKQQVNLVNVIMQRHLSTSVVQAINRICCRRLLDDQSRCPVSDVYIMLPMNWQGDAILGDIQASMPGINVVPWDYEPDGPKVYAPRSSSAHAAIISLMRSREAGMTPFPFIQRQQSLSSKQISRIREQLLNGGSNIAKALREIGVSYLVTGVGRGSKSYLVAA